MSHGDSAASGGWLFSSVRMAEGSPLGPSITLSTNATDGRLPLPRCRCCGGCPFGWLSSFLMSIQISSRGCRLSHRAGGLRGDNSPDCAARFPVNRFRRSTPNFLSSTLGQLAQAVRAARAIGQSGKLSGSKADQMGLVTPLPVQAGRTIIAGLRCRPGSCQICNIRWQNHPQRLQIPVSTLRSRSSRIRFDSRIGGYPFRVGLAATQGVDIVDQDQLNAGIGTDFAEAQQTGRN